MKLKMIRLKKLSFVTVAAVATLVMVVAAGSIFGAPKANAALSTNARNLAGVIAVDNVTGGSNGAFSNDTGLGDLIVLNSLFPLGTTADARCFAQLVAVSNLSGNSGTSGAFTQNSDLGDLLVLNNLFLDP